MNSPDPFGELTHRRGLPSGLLQRFPDRVLVMTTNRCFGVCPHCTRAHILEHAPLVDTPEKLTSAVDFVRRHPKVRDILLSGGDVLTLPDAMVMRLVDAFAALEQVEIIRICTRALVAKPERVTRRLARLLARSKKVWVNVHINTADEARIATLPAATLIDCGIPVSSQTVLLRGVNDSERKMLALLKALSSARIRPYYVFQCDPVEGLVERFGVPLAKAKRIESYCATHIGGLSLPRFVADLPSSHRKLPINLL